LKTAPSKLFWEFHLCLGLGKSLKSHLSFSNEVFLKVDSRPASHFHHLHLMSTV